MPTYVYTYGTADRVGIEGSLHCVLRPIPVEVFSILKPDAVYDPSYHPDGTQIIFVEHVRAVYRIVTVTVGATVVRNTLYSSLFPLQDPTFSEDGFFVLFSEEKTLPSGGAPKGVWRVRYVGVNDRIVNTIIDDGAANMHPCWVSSSQVAFQTWQYGATPSSEFQISVCDLTGRGRIDLGPGEYPRLGRM